MPGHVLRMPTVPVLLLPPQGALLDLDPLTTRFVGRLRARDPKAWFELWETFGPVLRAQLARWGRGRIGPETVQDLSQETLTALATAIDRHDPSKGARFSTWLLTIARYTLGDEIDRRMAQKRGEGVRPLSLDDSGPDAEGGLEPDRDYEAAVFEAKVESALRAVERQVGFQDFEIYRQRILESVAGKDVARSLGTSEATVSRRLTKVRDALREHLYQVFARYAFNDEDWDEVRRNGLAPSPNQGDDGAFDDAVAEVFHRASKRGTATATGGTAS